MFASNGHREKEKKLITNTSSESAQIIEMGHFTTLLHK